MLTPLSIPCMRGNASCCCGTVCIGLRNYHWLPFKLVRCYHETNGEETKFFLRDAVSDRRVRPHRKRLFTRRTPDPPCSSSCVHHPCRATHRNRQSGRNASSSREYCGRLRHAYQRCTPTAKWRLAARHIHPQCACAHIAVGIGPGLGTVTTSACTIKNGAP